MFLVSKFPLIIHRQDILNELKKLLIYYSIYFSIYFPYHQESPLIKVSHYDVPHEQVILSNIQVILFYLPN